MKNGQETSEGVVNLRREKLTPPFFIFRKPEGRGRKSARPASKSLPVGTATRFAFFVAGSNFMTHAEPSLIMSSDPSIRIAFLWLCSILMDQNKMDIDDVIIIGAGPAGLSAGYILSRDSSLRVRILEADPVYVGGISRTENYKGFLFDIGGHRFFSKSKEIENLWDEFMPRDFPVRSRSSRICYGGKFYKYPLHAFEVLLNLGVVESFFCVCSYARSLLFPIKNPKSFEDWVSNQFGSRLFRIFFKTYTEKVWGMSCKEISADWAAQRIKGLNLPMAVLSALRKSFNLSVRSRNGATVKTLIESFRYPSRGPGMMWEAVANHFKKRGGTLCMGEKAVSIKWDEAAKLWSIATSGEEKIYYARQVVSSAPMGEVVAAVDPRPASADKAAKLRYRDFVLVALMLKSPPNFGDNWIYVHDPNLCVGRVQNFGVWSSDLLPGPNKWCLGMEYFCFEGDEFWKSDDNVLINLATEELKKLKLVASDAVFEGRVVRQPKAYPIYDDEYKDIIAAIREEFEARHPTFHFIGRNGMHRYNNQDHAMMTGILTAKNIMAGNSHFDVWSVNEDASYHETAEVYPSLEGAV